MPEPTIDILLTAAFGLEAIVRRECEALGYAARVVDPGRILVQANLEAVARLNLWIRTAERVVIRVGTFDADDFGTLFDQTCALPWEQWIPPQAAFPVQGRSHKSQLSSVPACQRMVKKAIVERLRAAHQVSQLPETGPKVPVEIGLLENRATLTIDTSGHGLHKRGYRPTSGPAPLRETLAAALVQLSFWRPDRPLIDPFCGTGTIAIEAAMIGRNMAPGLHRRFLAESWPAFSNTLWQTAREEAADCAQDALPLRIRAMDIHPSALAMARQHAVRANVAEDIHFHQKPFSELRSKREYGCVITNPPYGKRMGRPEERSGQTIEIDPDVEPLYRSMPLILSRLPTWSHYIFTGFEGLERALGRPADRRRKLYNGRIPCCYYQFHGPRPARKNDARDAEDAPDPTDSGSHPGKPRGPSESVDRPAFATEAISMASGSADTVGRSASDVPTAAAAPDPETQRQIDEFGNRLKKRARHLRRWPKRGITCYRIYERDIPEIPLVVDRYETCLHIAEFARPHQRTPEQHARWLDLMKATAAQALDVEMNNVFLKFRDRQRGRSQYDRTSRQGRTLIVHEAGLKFEVNLSDYIDTGLFLDHRQTRQRVREMAKGKRMLNLFGYTGAFSVYAAAGKARFTTTVDLSRTYLDWAQRNLKLNGLDGPQHQRVRTDAMAFLDGLTDQETYDLMVVDPPTFSNSKRTASDWDVQREQTRLFHALHRQLAQGGTLFFSTNYRRFQFDHQPWGDCTVREISHQSVPEDFRNRRIHRCWMIQKPQ